MALEPWPFGTKVFNAAGTQLIPGPQPTERLYTGQIWDWNANVHHYVARVYVPDLARFTSTDPVREYANPYAYVGWRPTGATDPTGMWQVGVAAFGFVPIGAGVAVVGSIANVPLVIAVGAGIGGGAVVSAIMPGATIGDVIGGDVAGGATGAIPAVGAGTVLSPTVRVGIAATTGAVGSTVGSMTQQMVDKGEISATETGIEAGKGLLASGLANGGAQLFAGRGGSSSVETVVEDALAFVQDLLGSTIETLSSEDDIGLSLGGGGARAPTTAPAAGELNLRTMEELQGVLSGSGGGSAPRSHRINPYHSPYEGTKGWALQGPGAPALF